MAISKVEINDFLVFRGKFECEFCSGINVLIGGNGTGKTTLMKVMYAAVKKDRDVKTINRSLSAYFRAKELATALDVVGAVNGSCITFSKSGKYSVSVSVSDIGNSSTVYIPVTEMLSHSEGMTDLFHNYQIPFDLTEMDILSNSKLPVTREQTPNAKKLAALIGKTIGGDVLYQNDTFYIQKSSDKIVAFSLEASGFRKFGLLWKLLRNGLLEEGSVLFWDEPENSLNPELIPTLVDVLFELQRNGVQVFLATHSEMLADYFNLRKKNNPNNQVEFHSLFANDSGIASECNGDFDLLKRNKLSDQIVEKYKERIEGGK